MVEIHPGVFAVELIVAFQNIKMKILKQRRKFSC